jgi:hypothetical protein
MDRLSLIWFAFLLLLQKLFGHPKQFKARLRVHEIYGQFMLVKVSTAFNVDRREFDLGDAVYTKRSKSKGTPPWTLGWFEMVKPTKSSDLRYLLIRFTEPMETIEELVMPRPGNLLYISLDSKPNDISLDSKPNVPWSETTVLPRGMALKSLVGRTRETLSLRQRADDSDT